MQLGAWATHPLYSSSPLIHGLRNTAVRWYARIAELIEPSKYTEMCWKQPTRAYDLLLPYFCLRRLGYTNGPLDEVTRWLGSREYLLARERPPFRVLEFNLLLEGAGYIKPFRRRTLLERGSLLAVHDPLYLDTDDVYSLTHILMYATDLARCQAPLRPSEHQQIGEVLQCLLVDYARRQSWDLLGELLIAFRCLGLECTPIVVDAAQSFLQAWREDGRVYATGQESRAADSESGAPEDRTKADWANCYHTTLVAIMFAVLWPQSHVD